MISPVPPSIMNFPSPLPAVIEYDTVSPGNPQEAAARRHPPIHVRVAEAASAAFPSAVRNSLAVMTSQSWGRTFSIRTRSTHG